MEDILDIWYWKYKVTIFNDVENCEKTTSGITIGHTMADAVATIEKHYGNDLVRLEYLEAIVDGILDFETAADYNWDITANKGLLF